MYRKADQPGGRVLDNGDKNEELSTNSWKTRRDRVGNLKTRDELRELYVEETLKC
jgi:hypothetical protein